MLETPLRNPYKLKINIRPIRYAYFVWEGDISGTTRAMRFMNTQWGGIRSLVIPIKEDMTVAPIFKHLLQLHEPDRFVEYLTDGSSPNYDAHNWLASYLVHTFPWRRPGLQMGFAFERHDETAHPLSMLPEADLGKTLTDRHLKGDGASELLQMALYGAVYPEQQIDYKRVVELNDEDILMTSSKFWTSQLDLEPFTSVLNLTALNVVPHRVVGSFESNHFDIVVVDSVQSICAFWDFRATREASQAMSGLRRRTILLPRRCIDDKLALSGMLTILRENLFYRGVAAECHLIFTSNDGEEGAILADVLSSLPGMEPFIEQTFTVTSTWSLGRTEDAAGLIPPHLKYAFGNPLLPDSFLEGIRGTRVPITTNLGNECNEVLFTPPTSYVNKSLGSVAVDYECAIWKRYPRTTQIAQTILRDGWFSKYGLTATYSITSNPTYLAFNLPTEWKTLEAYFGAHGYGVRPSKPGIYGGALVGLLGGWPEVGVIAQKQVYLLFDLLALASTKKIAQRISKSLNISEDNLERVRQALDDTEIVAELNGITKTLGELKNHPTLQSYRSELVGILSQLCELQVTHRGFLLACPHCGATEWYPLDKLNERLMCWGCGHEFPLPVEKPAGGEIQWEYRLNTLVNRAVDQDVLPSVLSVYYLTKDKEACCKSTGIELVKNDQVSAELDFLYVCEQKLYLGECKAGKVLTEKDMRTARLAAAFGAQTFYFTTIREFDDESLKLIEQTISDIRSMGLATKLEVLTGRELLGEPL